MKFVALPPQDYYLPPSGVDTPRWDGIVVERGGELVLRHTRLTGTLQGVEAKPGFERLWLDSVAFGSATDARVVVAGRVAPVKNVALFSLRTSGIEAASASAANRPRWKAPVRIGLAGIAVAGAGATVVGIYVYAHNLGLYEDSKDAATHTTAEVVKYERDAKNGRIVAIVGGAVAIVGAAGFALTFTF